MYLIERAKKQATFPGDNTHTNWPRTRPRILASRRNNWVFPSDWRPTGIGSLISNLCIPTMGIYKLPHLELTIKAISPCAKNTILVGLRSVIHRSRLCYRDLPRYIHEASRVCTERPLFKVYGCMTGVGKLPFLIRPSHLLAVCSTAQISVQQGLNNSFADN